MPSLMTSAFSPSRIVTARHGFWRGEYKYYSHPLLDPVASLRPALYEPLVPLANRRNEVMGIGVRYTSALNLVLFQSAIPVLVILLNLVATQASCL